MVDTATVDPNADKPQGEEAPVDTSEFDAAWGELEEQDKAGADEVPPDPEAEKLNQAGGEPQGSSSDAPPADAPPPAAGASENQPDDPWKDAPEHLRTLHQQTVGKLEQTIRSNAGRLSHVTTELNSLKASLDSQRDANGATKAGEEATDRNERMKQLREEYPEVAGPLLDMIQNLEEQLRPLKAAETARTEATVSDVLDQNERLVGEAHGDLYDKLTSKDASHAEFQKGFVAWAETQPRYVQEAINRNGQQIVDPAETIDILNRFRAETMGEGGEQRNGLTELRRRQLDGGRLPATKQPGASPAGKPQDDFDKAWDELEAKDRARAAGRR